MWFSILLRDIVCTRACVGYRRVVCACVGGGLVVILTCCAVWFHILLGARAYMLCRLADDVCVCVVSQLAVCVVCGCRRACECAYAWLFVCIVCAGAGVVCVVLCLCRVYVCE